jgi:putative membrane protein
MHGFGGFMGFGFFFWIIFLVILVWVVKSILEKQNSGSTSAKDDPLDILKKRYANGEISKEEFERMKRDLLE